uniref:zinc finger protein 32-like n=1 Tax=Semicossyphus pulcher TaxID=241346 RepID=UPI0037E76E01
MSSVECLREFVNERLTAAAEEIFGFFKRTIVEYEQELDRQRRLLDIVWKPHIKLQRIELPQQHVCKVEEVFDDQQLCNQERNSTLDQESPDIKEEQKELCISQEEQLLLKQQTDILILTSSSEENDHSEPELKINHQRLFHNSHVTENQHSKGGKHGYSGSLRDAGPDPKEILHTSRSHNDFFYNPKLPDIHRNTHTGQNCFQCDKCGKAFRYKSKFQRHLNVHTGEKVYVCRICRKRFNDRSNLSRHIRGHTSEEPYSCLHS